VNPPRRERNEDARKGKIWTRKSVVEYVTEQADHLRGRRKDGTAEQCRRVASPGNSRAFRTKKEEGGTLIERIVGDYWGGGGGNFNFLRKKDVSDPFGGILERGTGCGKGFESYQSGGNYLRNPLQSEGEEMGGGSGNG